MNKTLRNPSAPMHFRKFSRKKYATFNSLGKLIRISTLGVACAIIASPVQGQNKNDNDSVSKKLELEEVEVVGQKSTVLIDELPRFVELIDAQIIQNAPQQSFQDLLQYSSNIDVSQRGPAGVQSDISIRGGSFDQILVLQNGINLSDPQTGHHNFNLSIDRESIYKIEVLNGPAARALGANAYTGAVNIITRPKNVNNFSAALNLGQHNYLRSYTGINLTTDKTQHLISGSFSKSDGYFENTDFKATNLFYHGNYQIGKKTMLNAQFGLNNKAFGAHSFYTPKFPEQFEETSTKYFRVGLKTGTTVKIKTNIFWRRHNDRFELFRESSEYYSFKGEMLVSNNPDKTLYDSIAWYTNHNYHQTDIFGANLNASYRSTMGTTTVGAGIRSENLLSNAIGKDMANEIPVIGADNIFYNKNDYRNSFDVFLEHAYQGKKLFISGGTLLHLSSFEPGKLNFIPGIDAGVKLNQHISLVASYNYTIGHPTFTDLGYRGPTNQGNEDLKPYKQHSYETGFKFRNKYIQAGIIGFYSKGENNINWVRNDSLNRYLATNIDLSENYGIESFFRYKNNSRTASEKFFHSIYVGYTFIDTYRSTEDYLSKYTNIRNKFVLQLEHNPFKNMLVSWNFMYKQRIGDYLTYDFEDKQYIHNKYPDAILVNLRVSQTVKDFTLYVEGNNILDKAYVESGSIPQPGRGFYGGIKYDFDF